MQLLYDGAMQGVGQRSDVQPQPILRGHYRAGVLRLSDIEDRFICRACGRRGADVRPDFTDTPTPRVSESAIDG